MFLVPAMLFLGILGLVPVLLYLVRPRPRDRRITTLAFFQKLAREHQEANWLRRLKRLLSLLLTLLVMAALVLGLARWVLAPAPGEVSNVVLLFDTSASMAARQEDGPTRLEEALERAQIRLDALPDSIPVSVVRYDARAEVLVPATRRRVEVEHSLDQLEPRPLEGDPAKALELARQLAAIKTPAEIWHFTDTAPETGPEMDPEAAGPEDPEAVAVRTVDLALPDARNAGLTAFRLRRLPLDRRSYEAFVQVHGSGFENAKAELVAKLDGEPLSVRKLALQGEEPVQFTLPFGGSKERILTLELALEGDHLETDNVIHGRIPESKPVTVAWLAEEPGAFTRLALQALATDGDLKVKAGGPVWPLDEEVDLVVFDGWLPDPWPAGLPAIVIDPPPADRGPLVTAAVAGGGQPILELRLGKADHPVLFGVDSARVNPFQTATLRTRGGLVPLWLGPSGTVLAAGEYEGQRVSILAADPDISDKLPFSPALPLLLGNMIRWTAQGELEASLGNNLPTGTAIESADDEKVQWYRPAGRLDEARALASTDPGGNLVELDRVGIWRSGTGSAIGSASLQSVAETRLPAAPASAEQDNAERRGWLGGDMTSSLVVVALVVLMLESLLFHRFSVY